MTSIDDYSQIADLVAAERWKTYLLERYGWEATAC